MYNMLRLCALPLQVATLHAAALAGPTSAALTGAIAAMGTGVVTPTAQQRSSDSSAGGGGSGGGGSSGGGSGDGGGSSGGGDRGGSSGVLDAAALERQAAHVRQLAEGLVGQALLGECR